MLHSLSAQSSVRIHILPQFNLLPAGGRHCLILWVCLLLLVGGWLMFELWLVLADTVVQQSSSQDSKNKCNSASDHYSNPHSDIYCNPCVMHCTHKITNKGRMHSKCLNVATKHTNLRCDSSVWYHCQDRYQTLQNVLQMSFYGVNLR